MNYLKIISGIAFFDLLSKEFVKRKFPSNNKIEIIKNKFYIWHIKNKGFAYSNFKESPNKVFFGSLIIFICTVIYFIKLLTNNGMKVLKFGLSIVIGGAIGNLFERATKREVTDFLYINIKNTPIFNIADIFIFLGCIISMLSSVFYEK